MSRRSSIVVAITLLLLRARDAKANGRYPAASDVVVGPGASSDTLVVRTTFGLLTSDDRGLSWRWICEDALDRAGTWDAAVVLAADGNLVLGVPTGIRRTSGRCDVTTPIGSPYCYTPDLAADPAGERVAAAVGCTSGPNGVATSADRGNTFVVGATLSDFFVETVEVAASDAKRIYVSGYSSGVARLLRSDDGGATLAEVTRDFLGGNSAFVSAVDGKNADVVYVRSDLGVGTMLLKSIDAGAHFTKIGETKAKMVGFALSDDGRTVWMGSADRAEGILRSIDGAPFARVAADVTVRCMRFHAGRLYVCGDDFADGFTLACSHDGGDHLHAIFSLQNVIGPEDCPSGSVVNDVCAPLWPAQESVLKADAGPPMVPSPCDDVTDAGDDARPTDATTSDAIVDDTSSVVEDTAVVDASSPAAKTTHDVAFEGSGCALRRETAEDSYGAPVFAAVLGFLRVSRRRRRRASRA